MGEQKNLFLAIGLSIAIIVIFQLLFPQQAQVKNDVNEINEQIQPAASIDNNNTDVSHIAKPKEEVSGNVQEDEDVYGERKHTYTPEPNGNLQMEQMMGKLMNKLDNFDSPSQTGVKAIEVDIKKEIAIGKADMSSIKSQEFKGKVKTKKDKLKALRKRNNSRNPSNS